MILSLFGLILYALQYKAADKACMQLIAQEHNKVTTLEGDETRTSNLQSSV